MSNIYAPEWLALRAAAENKYRALPSHPKPPEEGWTWNNAKTKTVKVTNVRLARWCNSVEDKLQASTGISADFPWAHYWATEGEAAAALVAHHEAQVAKLKKQIASAEKKIAALRSLAASK
jgi:hypothetical protein